MKKPSPRTSNEKFKAAIARSIDAKIERLEARSRPRAGENSDTTIARARWLQLKAELTELEVRRRRNELVEIREIEAVISNVMANLRQRMLSFPSHILPELRRMVEIKPEQLSVLSAALKLFVHG
jgi:hypothetical protein